MNYVIYGKAQKTIDLPHPLGIASGKIIVDGNDVNAFAGQSVKISGQSRNQRLTFTGFHFGNLSVVQNNTADELNVVMALSQRAFGCLTNNGKSFGQKFVQGFTVGNPFAEFYGFVF